MRVGELEASLARKARGAGGVRAPQVREQTARQEMQRKVMGLLCMLVVVTLPKEMSGQRGTGWEP